MAPKRHSYTFRFKKETLFELDRNGGNISKTSTACNVSRQCIISWKKLRESYHES